MSDRAGSMEEKRARRLLGCRLVRGRIAMFVIAAVAAVAAGWRANQAPAALTEGPATEFLSPPAEFLSPPAVLAGEFEPVAELLLAWDDYFEEFLLEVTAAVWGQAMITFVLDESRDPGRIEEALTAAGLDPSEVRIASIPIDSVWIRDFGPFVVRRDGGKAVVSFDYYAGDHDDSVPEALRDALWPEWDLVKVDLELEGGNLLSDGTGRCLTAAPDPEAGTGRRDLAALAPVLRDTLGCRRLLVLPPLDGEATGHVDMFVHVTGPGRALVGRYSPAVDPENAARLDEAAAILRHGGFRVRRIPMPHHDDGRFRTHTNALAVNGVVLVPVYPEDETGEDEALAAFRAEYPGREIVPVVASEIIALAGAVHCAALAIPR